MACWGATAVAGVSPHRGRHGGEGAGEESLVGLGDSGAVPGGEQVQQQAADHGHAEAGVGPGASFIRAGFDQGVGDRRDPGPDDPVEEPLGAGAAAASRAKRSR